MNGHPPDLAGGVRVRLRVTDGRIDMAGVAVERPAAIAAALLAGRPVAEALRLVPLLFSLCGTAQAAAAAAACEDARHTPASPALANTRALLVLGEAAASHAWQVLMEWPDLLGEAPQPRDAAALRRAAAALARAADPAGTALRPGGTVAPADREGLDAAVVALSTAIDGAVFAGAPCPADADSLTVWATAGASVAARLLDHVFRHALAGFGASPVAPLPDRPAAWFAGRLAGEPGYAMRPEVDGAPAHTGPLARQAGHPLIADLTARHGTGLAAHFAARLVELAGLPRRLAALAAGPTGTGPTGNTGPSPRPASGADHASSGQAGAAAVETARGRLIHRVVLAGDRIADYCILAPTEWNFHPAGPVARGLEGAPAGADPAARARLLVAALDPCVPATITVEASAHA
jgi:coenzyme F420-reducing hydrogenase alpha subunit